MFAGKSLSLPSSEARVSSSLTRNRKPGLEILKFINHLLILQFSGKRYCKSADTIRLGLEGLTGTKLSAFYQ
jgi:hypothetical protein